MTAPTPREQVAEVLAAHGEQHIATVDSDLWCVTCDRIIGSAEGDDAETDRVIAAHQVDMLAAAGLLPDREEWGVQWTGLDGQIEALTKDRVESWTGTEHDREQGRIAVHRYVTEWRTA